MYCRNCGKQITDDSVFCRYCGKKQQDFKNENNKKISVSVWDAHYSNFSIQSFDKEIIYELFNEIQKLNPQLAKEYIKISDYDSGFTIHPVNINLFAPEQIRKDAKRITSILGRYFYENGFSKTTIPHVSGNSDDIRTTYSYIYEK